MKNLTLFIGISVVTCVSSAIFTPEQTTYIVSLIEGVMSCKTMPGLSLAVVRGEESWSRGFGQADREAGVNVTSDTMFGIGSLTKAFTSTLLAIYLNESNGRWTWDSKVHEVLGSEFAFFNEDLTREITLKDLVTHRTGMMTADLALFAGYDTNFTTAEFAKRIRFLPPERPIRDKFEYNNWIYALAGRVVEVISGQSYGVALKRKILDPLGMTQTKMIGGELMKGSSGVAQPYFLVENQLVLTDRSLYDISPGDSAGSIASSAGDMAKWMQFLMREGRKANNQSLMYSENLAELFKLQEGLDHAWYNSRSIFKPQFPASDVNYGYGYGWFVSAFNGHRKTWHSGGLHSYITYLMMLPDLHLGVYISVNGPGIRGTGSGQQALSYFILNTLLGEETWLNQTTACSYPEPWREVKSASTDNSDVTNEPVECPECYVGKYGHQLFGDVEVTVTSESRSLMLRYGRLVATLNSTDVKEKFKMDAIDSFRLFSRPGNDTVLVPVTFHEYENDKYNLLDITYPYNMTFSRSIRFTDQIDTSTASENYVSFALYLSLILSTCILKT